MCRCGSLLSCTCVGGWRKLGAGALCCVRRQGQALSKPTSEGTATWCPSPPRLTIQRFYMVMDPLSPPGRKARLVVVPKKRLPSHGGHERFYSFVQAVAERGDTAAAAGGGGSGGSGGGDGSADPDEGQAAPSSGGADQGDKAAGRLAGAPALLASLGAHTYETKTRGTRHQGAARLLAEAVYVIGKGGGRCVTVAHVMQGCLKTPCAVPGFLTARRLLATSITMHLVSQTTQTHTAAGRRTSPTSWRFRWCRGQRSARSTSRRRAPSCWQSRCATGAKLESQERVAVHPCSGRAHLPLSPILQNPENRSPGAPTAGPAPAHFDEQQAKK